MATFDANFIANAGIKDIVGQGLIFNDNIALIELVKNSKDSGSKSVSIRFKSFDEDTDKEDSSNEFSEIIIADSGCGMNQQDIENKWLNIAYSEKKRSEKMYAGNKGVGRFSCDRLGAELTLYTKSSNGEYLKLPIDWRKFEDKGQKDEISTIPLKGENLSKEEFFDELEGIDEFNTGTVLKIRCLRSSWGLNKLKKLVNELEKFSPSLDDDFAVYLYVDRDFDDPIDSKLNKKIDNGILDKLAFKTTYIKSSIDANGKEIETSLYYQGNKLYFYRAENPYKNLRGISVEIHYLDTLSKSYFTKNIGMNANTYGSIFLFYNRFRISPYGNEKNDWLGLDQRKSQGTSRYLGTRDVFGRIDILDKDSTFSVITSREGLAHNSAFYDLVAYDPDEKTILKDGRQEYGFVTLIIRQLENFVVSGLDWNRVLDRFGKKNVVSADDVKKNPSRFEVKELDKEAINEACDRILKSSLNVTDFTIDSELISKIQEVNEKKYQNFLSDFVSSIGKKSFSEINPREKGALKKIIEKEQSKTVSALEQWDLSEKKSREYREERDLERQKGLYLLSTRRLLSEDADGLVHTMKINNIEIKEGIEVLSTGIELGKYSNEQIVDKLSAIKLYALKTLKLAELATRSSFDRDIEVRSVDVEKYIVEYLDIYKDTFSDNGIQCEYKRSDKPLMRSLSVLNLSIVIDNLISNSVKWGADTVFLEFKGRSDSLSITISDNGQGVSERFLSNPDVIFDLGVRDEPPEEFGGSGIGLYYSRKLLRDMDAELVFVGNGLELSGATFEVVFN